MARIVIKKIGILFTLIICLLNYSCNQVKKKQELNLDSLTLAELIRIGYDCRGTDTFPEICQLLNDSILIRSELLKVFSTIHEFISLANNKDTIIEKVDWGFWIEESEPIKGGRDIQFLYVCFNNVNMFLNNELHKLSDMQKYAEQYIFHSDSTYWDYTKRKENVAFFGEIETSIVTAVLSVDVKKNNGLSVEEWRLFFDCMHELVVVFENKQNEIAMQKWNQDFNSLPNNKKLAIMDIVFPRIWIHFDGDCM